MDAVSRSIIRRQPGDGRLAAQIFLLLEEGLDLRQIVIRAQVPPPVVRVLYEEWCLPLEDWRQLSWSHKLPGQVSPPPTPRVGVTVADAFSGDATTVAVHADASATAPSLSTPPNTPVNSTPPRDSMDQLLVAAERLLGQRRPT